MVSDEVEPHGTARASSGSAAAPGAAAETPVEPPLAHADGWWEHVLPAYMPAGAWRPHTDGESALTAPVSPGSWMPPASSFHALLPGSSLATESGEPVVPTLAALASATSIPGLAHGTSIDGSALDDAVPTLAMMTGTVSGEASPLERVQEAVDAGKPLAESVPERASGAVRAYDPAAFERAQSLAARYATEGGAATAVTDAARASGIPVDATPRQAALSVRRLAAGVPRPVLPTSVIERHRANVRRVVTSAAVLAGVVVLTTFVLLAPDDESAGAVGLGLLVVGLVQAGFLVRAIALAIRGRLLRIASDGAGPLSAILLLTLCSPIPVLLVRFTLDALA